MEIPEMNFSLVINIHFKKGENLMERYVAYGLFKPQKYQKKFKETKDKLCIDIPSSHAYESKEKAKKELNQAYRFVSVEGDVLSQL